MLRCPNYSIQSSGIPRPPSRSLVSLLPILVALSLCSKIATDHSSHEFQPKYRNSVNAVIPMFSCAGCTALTSMSNYPVSDSTRLSKPNTVFSELTFFFHKKDTNNSPIFTSRYCSYLRLICFTRCSSFTYHQVPLGSS
jgi:hypothetical protein